VRVGRKPLPEAQILRGYNRREVSLSASLLMNNDPEFVDSVLVTSEETDQLVGMLSEESRDLLFRMPEQLQREAVLSWIRQQDQLKQLPARDYVPKLMEMYRKHNSSLPSDQPQTRLRRP